MEPDMVSEHFKGCEGECTCAVVRKQIEMEVDVVSEQLQGWEGEPIHTLGDMLHSGIVKILSNGHLRSSRFLVAFPETIIIFNVEKGPSEPFIYEGRLPMSGLVARRIDPAEGHPFAFELSSNRIQQPLTVICSSVDNLNEWLQMFPSSNIQNLTTRMANLTLPDSSPLYSSQIQSSVSSGSSLKNLLTRQKHVTERPEPQCLNTDPETLRQMQVLKRRDVRWPTFDSVPSSSPVNSRSTNQPSTSAQSGTLHLVRDSLQEVEAATCIQTAPHMIATAVNNGECNPVKSPPSQSSQPMWLRPQSQILGPIGMSNSISNTATTIESSQVLPNSFESSLNMASHLVTLILTEDLEPPLSSQQRQQVLEVLKSKCQLMSAFYKDRPLRLQQQLSTNQPSPSVQSGTSPLVRDSLQEVDATACIQRAPRTTTIAVNYGEGNPVLSSPSRSQKLKFMQQRIQKHHPQMSSGVPKCLVGMENVTGRGENSNDAQNHQPRQSSQPMGLRSQSQLSGPSGMSNSIGNTATTIESTQVMPNPLESSLSRATLLQAIAETLKEPPSSQRRQQVLKILKSNPQLMSAFYRHRNLRLRQQMSINEPSPNAQSGTSPLVRDSLQEVESAAACIQTAPYVITTAVNNGEGNHVASPPSQSHELECMQQQIQKNHPQMSSGVPKCLVGMENVTGRGENSNDAQNHQPRQSSQPMGLRPQSQLSGPSGMSNSIGNTATTIESTQVMPNPLESSLNKAILLQTVTEALKAPPSSQKRQQVLEVLKSDPQLLSAFHEGRALRLQQQQEMSTTDVLKK